MQMRMQHRQSNGQQQLPASQMGPFAGPGSFPFYGELHWHGLSAIAEPPISCCFQMAVVAGACPHLSM